MDKLDYFMMILGYEFFAGEQAEKLLNHKASYDTSLQIIEANLETKRTNLEFERIFRDYKQTADKITSTLKKSLEKEYGKDSQAFMSITGN